MGVQSKRDQLYLVTCDICKRDECLSSIEDKVHSERQAVYAANFHVVKSRYILCDECFERYRKARWKMTYHFEGVGKLTVRSDYTDAVLHFEPEIDAEVLTTRTV